MNVIASEITITESNGAVPLCSATEYIADANRGEWKSLSEVWDFVVKEKSLPESVDTRELLTKLQEKLRNVEWIVRQHALRLLNDVIPVLHRNILDRVLESTMQDVIANLGHDNLAVKKGAIDCLRTYVKCSKNADHFVRNLVQNGVQNAQLNYVPSGVVSGIIIAVPSLVTQLTSIATTTYITQVLFDELVNGGTTKRETVFQVVLKIKEIVGSDHFSTLWNSHLLANNDLLVDLAGSTRLTTDAAAEYDACVGDDSLYNPNEQLSSLDQNSLSIRPDYHGGNKSALHTSHIMNETNISPFRVLPEQDYRIPYHFDSDSIVAATPLKRTPRRVRFGGEIVKLRTPDSDVNSIPNNRPQDKILLKSSVSPNYQAKAHSRIPIRRHVFSTNINTTTHSAPNSPFKQSPETARQRRKISQSSPNLRDKTFNKISKIPRLAKVVKEGNQQNLKQPLQRRNSREDEFSPIPIHNEIEVIYNLTRTPSPSGKVEGRTLHSADDILLKDTNETETILEERIHNSPDAGKHLQLPSDTSADSFSACSETADAEMLHTTHNIEHVIRELNSDNDIRTREQAIMRLLADMRTSSHSEFFENTFPNLMTVLCNAQKQTLLQIPVERAIAGFFNSLRTIVLQRNAHQIAEVLCRISSPSNIRLAIVLLQRLSPKVLLEQLLAPDILKARNSRIREGSLHIMIVITRLFPSSDTNLPECVNGALSALHDINRNVRRAALEYIASLAQLSGTKYIQEMMLQYFDRFDDKCAVFHVVNCRLSSKQLPMVDVNGNIRYPNPKDVFETEWIQNGSIKSRSSSHLDLASWPVYSNSSISDVNVQSIPRSGYWGRVNRVSQHHSSTSAASSASENELRLPPRLERNEFLDRPNFWQFNSRKQQLLNESEDTRYRSAQKHTYTPDSDFGVTSQRSHKISEKGMLRPLRLANNNTMSQEVKFASTSIKNFRFISFNWHLFSTVVNSANRYCQKKTISFNSGYLFVFHVKYRATSHRRRPFSIRPVQNQKSLSSDNLLHFQDVKKYEEYFCPSSDSSANSWNQRFKDTDLKHVAGYSGIPVLVYGNTTSGRASEYKQQTRKLYKASTLSKDDLPKISPVTNAEHIICRQPYSPGSESSGYFTPPAESHLFNLEHADYGAVQVDGVHNEESSDTDEPQVTEPCMTAIGEDKDPTPTDDQIEIDFKSSYAKVYNGFEPSDDLALIGERSPQFNSNKHLSESDLNIVKRPEVEIARKSICSAPALSDLDHREIIKVSSADIRSNPTPSIVDVIDCEEKRVDQNKIVNVYERPVLKSSSKKTPERRQTRSRDNYHEIISLLEGTDWDKSLKGLQGLQRLVEKQPDVVEAQIQTITMLVGRHIRNLRSQVSRAACSISTGIFENCKKGLEMHLEEMVVPLLHRTADTNRFLRNDANKALDTMCENCAPAKVVQVLSTRGLTHQNAVVRCTTIRLLGALVTRLGADRVFLLPRDTRERIVYAGAQMLLEGSLESRKHAKLMFTHLGSHNQFTKTLTDAVPSNTLRHIEKTIKNIT